MRMPIPQAGEISRICSSAFIGTIEREVTSVATGLDDSEGTKRLTLRLTPQASSAVVVVGVSRMRLLGS